MGDGGHRQSGDRRDGDGEPGEPRESRATTLEGGRRRRGLLTDLIEIDADVAGRLPPLPRILLQAETQQPDQVGRHVRRQARPVRVALQHARQHLGSAPAFECARTRQHLVQHAAEGEQVRARIDRLTSRLLGRHVRGGAEQEPDVRRRGQRRRLRRIVAGGPRCSLGVHQLRQAEVEHLDAPAGRDLHVRRFEVAVDHSLFVRRLEGLRDLASEVASEVPRQRSHADPLRERLAGDELHDQEAASLDFFQPMDGCDAGMVERRQRLGFSSEPRHPLGVAREGLGKELQRDAATQLRVGGEIDLAHRAGAQMRGDVVVRQPATHHGCDDAHASQHIISHIDVNGRA